MVSLESKPVWEARARAIGLPDGLNAELQTASLSSFGQWAFCCAGDPGSHDDTHLREAVQTLAGREVMPQEMVLCRGLYVEAWTYAVSDMRSRIDRSAEDKPRATSPAERMARIERRRTALVGVTWTA